MKKHISVAALLGLVTIAQAGIADGLKNWLNADADKAGMAQTVVIAPGYKMRIADKVVPIFGSQRCPSADGVRVWFFGGDPHGGTGCVVIEKDTVAVAARFVLDGKEVNETWAVERRAPGQTFLRRPNGDYLAQLN